MYRCVIPNCPSWTSANGLNFNLYRFGTYRNEWVDALKDVLPNLELKKNSRICSLHFDGVPSIYNPILPTLLLNNLIEDEDEPETIVEEHMPPEIVMGGEEEEVALDIPSPDMEMDTSCVSQTQDEENSIKAYYFLNHHYPCPGVFNLNITLPKEEILKRRLFKFADEGICNNYIKELKNITQNMAPSEKEICISFDELYITVGGFNTERVIVFNMHGIVSGWQMLLCYFKTKKGLKPSCLTDMIRTAVTTSEKIGFYVQCITCDQFKSNVSFQIYCCITDENGASYIKPEIFKAHRVYLVYDMCHLMDNIRKYCLNNNLCRDMEYTDQIEARLLRIKDIRRECFDKKKITITDTVLEHIIC
ncbi:uncharacterized protein LOC142240485 [Haematobia irritans]|uniref:uncharacterized protein LOC142240485 n=1 Tax=Haematobia irritans TaxID=7368 RepID=UPI003F50A1D4